MGSIKIIDKNIVEKIIDDIQKVSEAESIMEHSTKTSQNTYKRQVEKFINSLNDSAKIDLYALAFFGREIHENGSDVNLKLFTRNREQATDLIKHNGFHANYLISKNKLALYLNKSLVIYEIIENNSEFIF